MDKLKTISWTKAGSTTCLFLLLLISASAQQPSWLAREPYKKAYHQCLQLNLTATRTLLADWQSPEAYLILSLADALELLISEDRDKYAQYEPVYQQRLEWLKKYTPVTEDVLVAMAELRLQWSFVYLKFGHDFTAAWNLRQAHLQVQECRKRYPSSVPILKTSALLEVMLGSVPEKFQWVLGLLGMKGSVATGLDQLDQVMTYYEPQAREAALLKIILDGFILQQTDSALQAIEQIHFEEPNNRLILFTGAALAIKNANGEIAMNLLEKLKKIPANGLPIPYADYLLGEVYLHQGNYNRSIAAYESFLKSYRGENFIKDGYFKIGMAYWLSHRSSEAMKYFDLARSKGKAETEADKYAARALSEATYPNIPLTRARYAMDGGYYDEAIRILRRINTAELASDKEITEYAYRYARLYHQISQPDKAKEFYLQTITLSGSNPWYFAPNACLQLGYLYRDEGNTDQARTYFNKAMSYKKHEYKNSIDSKAKSALAQLNHNQ